MLLQRLAKFGLVLLLVAGQLTALAAEKTAASSNSGVQIIQLTNRYRVEINGSLFTEYYFKDVPKPYCYPVLGPGGTPMTRQWPLEEGKDEEHDHPHHQGIWFGHQIVNGNNFLAKFSFGTRSGAVAAVSAASYATGDQAPASLVAAFLNATGLGVDRLSISLMDSAGQLGSAVRHDIIQIDAFL